MSTRVTQRPPFDTDFGQNLPPFELHDDSTPVPLLEAAESTPQPAYEYDESSLYPALRLACTFRHSGWHRMRTAVYDSMKRVGIHESIINRFVECGGHASVWRDPNNPNRLQVRGSFCRSRWCLPCGQQRARLIAANLFKAIDGRITRFLTLTLKHTDRPLQEQVDHLYASFAALRRRAVWKRNVDAGAWFFELKHSARTDTWHPHLHILMTGRFIKHQDISDAWHAVTGDSFIVDIRLVRDPDVAARYVVKYASKPLNASLSVYADALDEAVHALRGRKLCGTFGDWQHVALLLLPDDPTPWEYVGRLGCLLIAANRGDLDAKKIVDHLRVYDGDASEDTS